jgi:hypothetical protein
MLESEGQEGRLYAQQKALTIIYIVKYAH